MRKKILLSVWIASVAALIGCKKNDEVTAPKSEPTTLRFSQPKKVSISGYAGDIMEPFLSRDGSTLFFNNLNDPSVNTNLHLAARINDTTFEYRGELKGVNTEKLEGVPTIDGTNVLYFVSTRNYDQTYSTIYSGYFSGDSITNIHLISEISKKQAGWVNFDVEVSMDGNSLFFVDGRFDQNGGPYEADIVLAERKNGVFQRSDNLDILKNINTSALEYAACISSDMLALYFTRVDTPLTSSSIPQIYVATRSTVNQPFSQPNKIETITGFVEAPALSADDQIIYYHKKVNNMFVLYMVRKE